MRPFVGAVVAMLAGCGEPVRDASAYAADPAAARRTLEACASRPRPDCDAARQGLADARRRERMARYETAF